VTSTTEDINSVVKNGLNIIHGLTKVVGPGPAVILETIALVVEAVRAALAGNVTPHVAQADIDALIKGVPAADAATDAKADAAAAERIRNEAKKP